MIRIFLADDHEAVRRMVRQMIEDEEGCTVCGEAARGEEAVSRAISLKPDVAILDYIMPGLDGIQATRHIRAASPNTEVVIFTLHHSIDLIRQAWLAGARGYVLKLDADRHLLAAVRALARHEPYHTDEFPAEIINGPENKSGRPGSP
jgi:DNA-binding NarL/FixJ family response regulator